MAVCVTYDVIVVCGFDWQWISEALKYVCRRDFKKTYVVPHVYMNTHIHTYIHTHTHACIHTYIHTHTRTHARTHARTHTHFMVAIATNKHDE